AGTGPPFAVGDTGALPGVSVLGMGGIGKSALAVTFMHQVADHFEVVFFRSLRDAPSCEALLSDCLQVLFPLSRQPLADVPASFERRLSLLLECLHERRALLVLDNLEALLQEGASGGHYRPGYVYAGNPLALKVVAETIVGLFAGEISLFLKQGAIMFGSIQELLAEQVNRLSAMEQTVLRWLAITREPLSFEELLALLVAPRPLGQPLEAMDSLRRRALIERGKLPGSLTLQAVVLEYVTGLLIEEATHEIEQQKLDRLIEHGLSQAGARDYVRQTQERLLVAPILARLRYVYPGRGEVEEHLLALLARQRERADDAQGYGPANLVTLLRS